MGRGERKERLLFVRCSLTASTLGKLNSLVRARVQTSTIKFIYFNHSAENATARAVDEFRAKRCRYNVDWNTDGMVFLVQLHTWPKI